MKPSSGCSDGDGLEAVMVAFKPISYGVDAATATAEMKWPEMHDPVSRAAAPASLNVVPMKT